jgi:prepilin-type N-terminal cleavage/methylation domain-containing protein
MSATPIARRSIFASLHGVARPARLSGDGFTLIEMAIVLLVITLLLGGLLGPLSVQVEQRKTAEAEKMLGEIQEALMGFAVAHGRLPCPSTPSSGGQESPIGGGTSCATKFGFVPAGTLGLAGPTNQDNLLLDPWGNPYRFVVADTPNLTGSTWDFTTNGRMKLIGMGALVPNLQVCADIACGQILTSGAPAVILSYGSDWGDTPSTAEQKNQGATLTGGPSGLTYPVPAATTLLAAPFNNTPGSRFDDVVTWLSPNVLYNRMVAGGALP